MIKAKRRRLNINSSSEINDICLFSKISKLTEVLLSYIFTGVGAYSAIIVITYMFYKRCTGEIQSPQSDETSKSSKRRSHHKKINSQTVQLVTFPSSEDINEGVHYDDDQECRGHHQEESSIDDDTQHRQDSRENESPLVGQIAEDQEPELVLTFSSVASGSRQIFNNSDNIRVLQSMSVENV